MKKIFTLALLALTFEHVTAQNCIENTNSIGLDGFSSYASTSNQTNLNISDSLTVEAWIYPASFAFNSANNSIVCKHGWSSGEGGFVLRCGGSGELSFNIAGLDVNQVPTSWKEVLSPTNALTLNTWTHVAGSYDGQTLRLYVNGVEVNTNSFQGSIVSSPNYPLTIGKLSDPNQFASRFFDGFIDEVRIWHRALPASELLANMNNHIDPTTATNLISYWRFNDGTATNALDLSGGNDLSLNAATWETTVPFNAVPPVPVITFNAGTLTVTGILGQWYLNGAPIAGATNLDYTPTVAGDYTYTAGPTLDGCTSTSAIYTVTSVGLKNKFNSFDVSVYPNPMVDEAVININTNSSVNNLNLNINDLTGRQVYSISNLVIKDGLTQIKINKDILNTGIYFYELWDQNHVLESGKLMVKN